MAERAGTTARTSQVDLRGRRALVTGAASGIGRACARRLAAAGAELTVLDRDAEGAKRVAHELDGRPLVLDLAGPDLDTLRVDNDILVNNAGLQHVAPVQEFPPQRFALLLRVVVEAPFRLARTALPGMYERGRGRIVNISSPAIKRLVEPEEVAELAAFLCSEAASFVNGASLTMDGGWSAR
jgi:3-hydroxybutyrate dehydrogenase